MVWRGDEGPGVETSAQEPEKIDKTNVSTDSLMCFHGIFEGHTKYLDGRSSLHCMDSAR